MEDIIGKKADDSDSPDPDDIIDRDLASPQFVSWSARKEVGQLHGVIHHLPELSGLIPMADEALRLVQEIDDAIEGWST